MTDVRFIPDGEILEFTQEIDEEEKFVVTCNRCPDVTLTPFQMGEHALKVHLRSSYHVKACVTTSNNQIKKHTESDGTFWCCSGRPDRGHSVMCMQHVMSYACCHAPLFQGHTIDCPGEEHLKNRGYN